MLIHDQKRRAKKPLLGNSSIDITYTPSNKKLGMHYSRIGKNENMW